MHDFEKPPDTIIKSQNSDNSGYDYENRFYNLDPKGKSDSEDQSEYSDNGGRHQPKLKRFVMDEGDLRETILKLFADQPVWSWDEIEEKLNDQPPCPLRRCVRKLCDEFVQPA